MISKLRRPQSATLLSSNAHVDNWVGPLGYYMWLCVCAAEYYAVNVLDTSALDELDVDPVEHELKFMCCSVP